MGSQSAWCMIFLEVIHIVSNSEYKFDIDLCGVPKN